MTRKKTMAHSHFEVQSDSQKNTRFYKTISIIAMVVGFYMTALVLYDLFSLYSGTDPLNMLHHFTGISNKSTIRTLAFHDITMVAPVALLMAMIYGPNLKTIFEKKAHSAS